MIEFGMNLGVAEPSTPHFILSDSAPCSPHAFASTYMNNLFYVTSGQYGGLYAGKSDR